MNLDHENELDRIVLAKCISTAFHVFFKFLSHER